MPGNPKSDIRLGFWLGVGLLILGVVLALAQLVLGKVLGSVKKG